MARLSAEMRSQIRTDREAGLSITELTRKYQKSKTTIWHNIRDIRLAPEKATALISRKKTSPQRSRKEWMLAEQKAKQLLNGLSIGQVWHLLFIALYWAEGTKSSFVFTNTDPDMIRLFIKFIRNFLGVNDERIDIMIRTSIPMKPDQCKRYWADVTGFPVCAVRINHNDQHNKSKTHYGMCRLTVRQGGYLLKLFYCLKKELVVSMVGAAPVV